MLILTSLQAKVNDRGIAALAYQVLLKPGVKVGFGVSFDTQHLKEASHKVRRTYWGFDQILIVNRSAPALNLRDKRSTLDHSSNRTYIGGSSIRVFIFNGRSHTFAHSSAAPSGGMVL